MSGPSAEFCRFVHAAITERIAGQRLNGVRPSPALRAELAAACAALTFGSWPIGDQEGLGGTPVAGSGAAADSGGEVGGPSLLVDRVEAARLLGVHPKTVQRLASKGVLTSKKVGARRMFARADLEEHVRGGGGE